MVHPWSKTTPSFLFFPLYVFISVAIPDGERAVGVVIDQVIWSCSNSADAAPCRARKRKREGARCGHAYQVEVHDLGAPLSPDLSWRSSSLSASAGHLGVKQRAVLYEVPVRVE